MSHAQPAVLGNVLALWIGCSLHENEGIQEICSTLSILLARSMACVCMLAACSVNICTSNLKCGNMCTNCNTLGHWSMQADVLVRLFAGLATTQSSRPTSSDEADLASWGGGPLDCAGLANVLVVASAKRMLHRLQGERDCNQ